VERVLVIGDVIDDIIVVPTGAIRANTDTDASIANTLGGAASNTASWAAHTGAEVTFIGCVGAKDENRIKEQFEKYNVRTELQVSTTKQTGTLIVLVEGDQRSMLTDRGANKELSFEKLTEEYLSDFSYVFISGYSLFGREQDEIQSLIQRVQDAGALLVLDPGSTGYIKDFGVEKFKEAINGVDILLPNEEEFALLSTTPAHITIVTKGSNGVDLYIEGIKTNSFEAERVAGVDPTGAGDAFAGALVANLSQGKELNTAIELATKTAAIAVKTIGARPKREERQ
jgi:sugar/nucleoside kinase (ribokinase family)